MNRALAGLAGLGLALTSVARSQLAPIGLSEVRGQVIEIYPSASLDPEYVGYATTAGDFNGDGADDLAIGSPLGTEFGSCLHGPCGFVAVRPGTVGGGLVDPQFTILAEDFGSADHNEHFGWTLARGDFDGDGFVDLAVGIPDNAPNGRGGVRIFSGAASGPGGGGSDFLSEATAGEPTHWCDDSHFGSRLATGDFDGDGFDDLAVGAPEGCDRLPGGDLTPGGSVFVFHGGESGLLPFSGYRMSQSSFGVDPVEEGDRFGAALAAGDFDGDSFADLAIGVPGESGHGVIEIVWGSEFGLLFATHAFWAPGALGELPEVGDELGRALASGDFDGDGYDDLAIGNPNESLPDPANSTAFVGKVDIAYGGATDFDLARTDRLTQGELYGLALQDGPEDLFGSSFAVGDFDGDGISDLAIGHPGDAWIEHGHGAVTVLMGKPGGFGSSPRLRFLTTGVEGIPGSATGFNQYAGHALAAGDFDGDGFSDLAIGIPGHDAPGLSSGGAVVLYGALFADGFELGSAGRWPSLAP